MMKNKLIMIGSSVAVFSGCFLQAAHAERIVPEKIVSYPLTIAIHNLSPFHIQAIANHFAHARHAGTGRIYQYPRQTLFDEYIAPNTEPLIKKIMVNSPAGTILSVGTCDFRPPSFAQFHIATTALANQHPSLKLPGASCTLCKNSKEKYGSAQDVSDDILNVFIVGEHTSITILTERDAQQLLAARMHSVTPLGTFPPGLLPLIAAHIASKVTIKQEENKKQKEDR